MEEKTDASLVALARSGNKQAFGELIERYQAMAQIITLRLVGNIDIAREMAQEAMLQAYLSLDHLRDDAHFKGWLYGIVLNVCRSYLREQKRPLLSLEAMLAGSSLEEDCSFSTLPGPQEALEKLELRQLMQEAVNLLSPKNRDVTFLFYYEQLSLQEIANKLGISVVAVKSRLHQARKELREWLLTAYPEMQRALPSERKRKAMIQVTIVEVVQQDRSSVVVLQDKAGRRALPVWVGYWEGEAIASSLRNNATSSPLTFNFMANLLKASGSEVVEVRIESLKEDTLYAVARVRHGNKVQEVEARPGDALALAVYAKSTVYVAEEVMERAGVDLPVENGKPAQQDLDKIVSKLKDRPAGLTTGAPIHPNRPTNLDFADGMTGWGMAGSHPQNYAYGIDTDVKRSGEGSGYMKAKLSDTGGFGTLMQTFDADMYRGKRVRMSGYVKSEGVELYTREFGWAGLWMRVDGPQLYKPLAFDNMSNRPIYGSTDWQKYEIVLDVPENSVNIAFGILLAGKGQVWLDGIQFEVVGQDVPTTDLGASPKQPRNLDFKQGTTGWFLTCSRPQNYEEGIDRNVKRSGEASAYLKTKFSEPCEYGGLMQMFDADDYRSKRVRLSGYIKSESVEPWAGLWMRVDGPNGKMLSFDNMQDRPIVGTGDWQKCEIVLQVPENSDQIAIGIVLVRKGQVWLDELKFEIVGQDILTTDRGTPADQPQNLNFAQGTTGWFLAGSHPQHYLYGIDHDVKRSGEASGYLKPEVAVPAGFGALMQTFKADAYQGKLVRLSGYVKTEAVERYAGLWMCLDSQSIAATFNSIPSALISGTHDRQKYEIIADVPQNSNSIGFGIVLSGKGQVWLSNVQFEIVSSRVPTTS